MGGYDQLGRQNPAEPPMTVLEASIRHRGGPDDNAAGFHAV
jgi:hypothetical protein